MIPYTFPQDGEYEIQLRLTRDRNEHVEGLREPHELEVLLDRERMASFTVTPPARSDEDHQTVDAHLKARIRGDGRPARARRDVPEEPVLAARDQAPAVPGPLQHAPAPAHLAGALSGLDHRPVSREGPRRHAQPPPDLRLRAEGRPATKKPVPDASSPRSLRRAYRRPVTDADLESRWSSTATARAEGDFDAGIEMALSAVLVNPQFLFRIEHDPAGVAPQHRPIAIRDLELASRLSFFLWSSIPDDELLDLAARGELRKPDVLERQVRRMLADPRSRSLVSNFAGAVAAPAQPGLDHAGPAPVPRLRRQPAAGLPPGDGALLRERRCARTAACSIC